MEKKKRKAQRRKPEVGRPTELTDETFAKIKEAIISGKDLGKTADFCEIPKSTFYTWHSDNYLKLADKIENWRRDRKLMLAELVIEEMLELPIQRIKENDKGEEYIFTDSSLVKIKQDTAKFVAETLGKENYSKRSELGGFNGGPIEVNVTDDQKSKIARRILGQGGTASTN